MSSDEQGFLYPKVNLNECVDCGLCERVCPVLNQGESHLPVKTYAAWNESDEVRMSSSSGGIFYALASAVICEGGVVFGARFDNEWNVVHDYTETLDGLNVFLGSKYVQSQIGRSFLDAENFLKSGRRILFSGTPCQLHSLSLFLRKDYGDLLVKVDVICHGVPSPKIWQEYIRKKVPRRDGITISFRDKRLGWEQYGLSITGHKAQSRFEFYECTSDNLFMNMFLRDLCLRPSCYSCPSKCGKSHSDITLGDFWGVKNRYPNDYSSKGVSAVLVHSKRGMPMTTATSIIKSEVTYPAIFAGNKAIEQSVQRPRAYARFWKYFYRNGIPNSLAELENIIKPNILIRAYNKSKRIAYILLTKVLK